MEHKACKTSIKTKKKHNSLESKRKENRATKSPQWPVTLTKAQIIIGAAKRCVDP